jgi:hypothetical protein
MRCCGRGWRSLEASSGNWRLSPLFICSVWRPPANRQAASGNGNLKLPGLAESLAAPNSAESADTVAPSIEPYRRDVGPPQREPRTCEEYRNVLCRFRDHCKKKLVRDVDRRDCLEFLRYLYFDRQ